MQVLLFDIDGTLIRSGGAGKAAMEEALRSEFGVREIIDRVPFAGRTDPSISHDLLRLHGQEPSAENIQRLRTAYLNNLPKTLKKFGGTVLPGVRDLLDCLRSERNILLGLLTGNVRAGAECKLNHFDLWHYFPFGAFADGIHERDDIARAATTGIAHHVGRTISPENIWVIGDTPSDVKCARAIGARAVAVATGWNSLTELQECGADHVFSDFRTTDLLLNLFTKNGGLTTT
jgi:phosphoglycolate phosphatase-like HAD superfamily hydrolase